MAKKKTKSDSVSFEEAIDELKAIVQDLEEGNLSLSDSLEKYEQGVKHLKHCFTALETAQQKIELLVELDEDGNRITEPFDDRATIRPGRKENRTARYAENEEAVNTEEESDNDSDSLF